jgi:hypothetical protein
MSFIAMALLAEGLCVNYNKALSLFLRKEKINPGSKRETKINRRRERERDRQRQKAREKNYKIKGNKKRKGGRLKEE